MYILNKDKWTNSYYSVNKIVNGEPVISIPFAPANTDYANFKAQILADEAELQDADGAVMPAEQAKAFVKELP